MLVSKCVILNVIKATTSQPTLTRCVCACYMVYSMCKCVRGEGERGRGKEREVHILSFPDIIRSHNIIACI